MRNFASIWWSVWFQEKGSKSWKMADVPDNKRHVLITFNSHAQFFKRRCAVKMFTSTQWIPKKTNSFIRGSHTEQSIVMSTGKPNCNFLDWYAPSQEVSDRGQVLIKCAKRSIYPRISGDYLPLQLLLSTSVCQIRVKTTMYEYWACAQAIIDFYQVLH